MLKLVKPSKKYLPTFVQVMDDYISDNNHFGRGGIDTLIQAIQDNKAEVRFIWVLVWNKKTKKCCKNRKKLI